LVRSLLKLRIEPFLRIVIPTSARRLDNQNGISFENSRDHGDVICHCRRKADSLSWTWTSHSRNDSAS